MACVEEKHRPFLVSLHTRDQEQLHTTTDLQAVN